MSATPPGALDQLCAAVRALLPDPAHPYDHAETRPFDRPALRELAAAHRVVPLLARAAGAAAEPELQQAARHIAMRGLLAVETLRRVQSAFTTAGIRSLAWKGPAIAQLAWGEVGSREFDDLDLVVHPADRGRARDVLLATGWARRHAMSDAQEGAIFRGLGAWEFVGPHEPRLLELHWEFSALRYAGRLPVPAVMERAVRLSLGGVHLLTPDRADTLALLAQHGAKHAWGRLEDVAVFAALARRDDDAVVTAHARAAAVGGGRAVLLGVELARRVLSVPRPEELDAATRMDTQVIRLAEEVLARWARGETEFRPPLRWDLRWTEGAPDRLRLLARATFDPTLQEWEAMRLPDALVGLYPALRPVRRLWSAVAPRRARPGATVTR
ncbi:MAG: nucleotidyltransferase family protein [Gemmatimonadetes bacterium]|nr:nucleotidyltransferase family protein [Gemmatimonadota bacterium]